MNPLRRIAIVTASLPFAALPVLSHADANMDACISAFVNASVQKQQPVTIYKFNELGGPLAAHPTKGATIELKARLKNSGTQVARATCVVRNQEVVLTMEGKPATTLKLAEVASR